MNAHHTPVWTRTALAALTALSIAAPALAQESQLHAEFRREGERIREDCGEFSARSIPGCATTLATDHPVHVAFGSIAPQNGFGIGPAFVTHYTPGENWRIGGSADAVAAFGGAWRAGAYVNFVRTAVQAPRVVVGSASGTGPATGGVHPYPVLSVYAQAISLPKLTYYGLGSETSRDARSFFGLGQTIVGGSGIVPITRGETVRTLNLAVLFEANGRFVDLRSGQADDGPSVEERFLEAGAPGLRAQPGFAQFGEGVRIAPSLANGRVRLNYRAMLQQYVAAGDSAYSFRRWTVDLGNEFPLYRNSGGSAPRDANTPNECAIDATADRCPSISRNRTGTVAVRGLVSRSGASNDAAVPFYFQQTLGGSDVNGRRMLPGYDDYRFRGPHLWWLQESIEHSIYGPIGAWAAADQGAVGAALHGSGFGRVLRSYAIGATVRAGGFPAVLASWATSPEGHHFAFTISTSLLGGSARPSLY